MADDTDFPPELIAAQKRSHQAWAAVEEHRTAVDTARRAEAEPVKDAPKWTSPHLRPWTEDEDARHEELMIEASAAAEALHVAIAAAGVGHAIDTIQGLHKAARAA
ncbi:hypothetical protein SAMN05216251_108205 [Actinacidiphila alni]|uniref:Uncharacterized protein n=1 Tax=Actinacidiphila alni TaxID=380248 RepID=A0A1I2G106_9ACTN|nr:hypothetical protein [Actinacidiphila alni]SFF11222.1 hypothetical protein SAMN05216251_108205 [Actinacidiphila alni]